MDSFFDSFVPIFLHEIVLHKVFPETRSRPKASPHRQYSSSDARKFHHIATITALLLSEHLHSQLFHKEI